MARRTAHALEEIVSKLRQVEVLTAQVKSVADAPDARRLRAKPGLMNFRG